MRTYTLLNGMIQTDLLSITPKLTYNYVLGLKYLTKIFYNHIDNEGRRHKINYFCDHFILSTCTLPTTIWRGLAFFRKAPEGSLLALICVTATELFSRTRIF